MNKRKIIGLVSMVTGLVIAGGLFFSNSNNDFLASLFGYYGENRPSDKSELCQFLQDRLADPNLKSPRFIHRYQTDYDTQCKEDALKPSAPEVTHESLGYFLHSASSGSEVFAGTNNYIQVLLDIWAATHPTPIDTTTSNSSHTTSALPGNSVQATADQPSEQAEHPKVRVHQAQSV